MRCKGGVWGLPFGAWGSGSGDFEGLGFKD